MDNVNNIIYMYIKLLKKKKKIDEKLNLKLL